MPMAAPIWPTSFTGAMRSRRAINEFGGVCWGNGERKQRSAEPIGVAVLDQDVPFEHRLCSSTNSGCRPVLATIWVITHGQPWLWVTGATILSVHCPGARRPSFMMLTLGIPTQGGFDSG